MLEDDHVVYVAQAPGRHRMRMFTEVGRRVLPHSTAVGKVLLAWQDEEQVRRVVHRLGLPPRTPRTLTTLEEFTAELAAVRARGWAVDDEEEEPGVRCLAVPVGLGPRAVVAVSVSAPASPTSWRPCCRCRASWPAAWPARRPERRSRSRFRRVELPLAVVRQRPQSALPSAHASCQ